MPYASPSSPTEDASRKPSQPQSQQPTIQIQQSSHRRARSANPMFSDEKGPGAFAPLPRVHRRVRQEKKAFFQFAEEDDNEPALPSPPLEDHTPTPIPPPIPAALFSPIPMPRPSVNVSQIVASSPPPVSDIPFPTAPESATAENSTSGRTLFPFPTLQRTPSESNTPELTRTPSTPIFLANGKPLKPSLKSSLSSPAINPIRGHPRSRSEPSTPSTQKNVHFADSDLESVVVFEKTGRPRAVSGQIDDTETETEGYESPASFSFQKAPDQLALTIDITQSSSVPVSNPSPLSNVHLETILFPRTRPPTLRGSILVKNVAFEKLVALRFTLDNWQTTSEVTCKYVCSLPSLPQPFPPEREAFGAPKAGWDRFSFLIRLEDVERKLAERTIFLAVRFTATGAGEWWDNNNGDNYRLKFRSIPEDSNNKSKPSPLRQQQDLKRSPLALDFDTDNGVTPPPVRKHQQPTFVDPRPKQMSMPTVNIPPPPSTLLSEVTNRSRSSSTASTSSIGSLRLSNYVPPAVTSPIIERPSNADPQPTVGPIVGESTSDTVPQTSSAQHPPGGQPISPLAPSIGSDSTYAALVEKWCFHQSSPETKPSSTPSEPWRSPYDGASYGSAYSYNHHQASGQVMG